MAGSVWTTWPASVVFAPTSGEEMSATPVLCAAYPSLLIYLFMFSFLSFIVCIICFRFVLFVLSVCICFEFAIVWHCFFKIHTHCVYIYFVIQKS